MTDTAGRRDILALPKAHLHLHFTGSMRIDTVRDLADKHGMRLPNALTHDYPPQLSGVDERGWFRFQRLYDAARACVRDEQDMRRVVREAGYNCEAIQRGLTGPKPYSCPLPGPRPLGARCFCDLPIASFSPAQTAVGHVVP